MPAIAGICASCHYRARVVPSAAAFLLIGLAVAIADGVVRAPNRALETRSPPAMSGLQCHSGHWPETIQLFA